MRTITEHVREMKDEALTCFCMECATCLDESEYNAVNYGGKRYLVILTDCVEVVVIRNHHTCTWCKFGLDTRDASPVIKKRKEGEFRSFYTCPICLKNSKLRLYPRTNDVMSDAIDEYFALGGES